MNFAPSTILVLLCLPAFGFAWRGIVLLRMREAKPGRMISASGVVAMISLWVFAGATPVVASGFLEIYREFELELPWATELTISLLDLPFRYGLLWYPFVFISSLCVLTMPEIFFYRPQAK